jgi:hypothetical protein
MNAAKIDAREALRVIEYGSSDLVLMNTFNLSAVGLLSLFDQLIEAGLLEPETLEQRLRSQDQTVAISAEDFPTTETAIRGQPRKVKVKLEPKQVVADITYGYGDSELMAKYGLSIRGLQTLFTMLIDMRLITQDELDNRRHWSRKSADLETFECPRCFKPQFFRFDECPQCGVIISKLPPEVRNGQKKPEAASWTVEMGNIKCELKTSGKSMIVTGLNLETGREIAQKLKELFIRLQDQLDKDDSGTDPRFWVQNPWRSKSDKPAGEGQDREWVIEVGRFTVTRTCDGEKLIIQGLREAFQREVLSALQVWVDSRGREGKTV